MSKTCSECGQLLPTQHRDTQVAPDTEPRTPRIVKPGHIFMKAKGGQTVMVKTAQLGHHSVKLATWSVEEYQAKVAEARAPEGPPRDDSVKLAAEMASRQAANYRREKAERQDLERKKASRAVAALDGEVV